MKLQGVLSKIRKKAFSFLLWSLSLTSHGVYSLPNNTPPFKHKDFPVVSADPHKGLGILPVTWCTVSVPLTLTLLVFVSSLLPGVRVGRDHCAGVEEWDGIQPFLGRQGGGGRRDYTWAEAPIPGEYFIAPLDFTYKDKIIKKFQDSDHRALKPQVWAPFWTWDPVSHVHEAGPENS